MTDDELPPLRRLAIALLTVALLATTVYVLVARPFRDEGTLLTAEFGRAGQGLGDNAPVKVRGVDVGSVDHVELAGNGRVKVTLDIDPGVRIPDSVSAAIEPSSIFGPKFVNLTLGAREGSGPYLASGARIARTADPRDLSDLLGDADATLAAIDPDEVATIMSTLAQGLDGQGAKLRATIDQGGVLLNVAHEHRQDARRFLADGAALTGTLADAGSGDDLIVIAGGANTLITDLAAGGENRLGGFSDQISELSALVSHGFDKRGRQLGEGFRSGERAVSILYSQLGLLGGTVRTGGSLLPLYGELAAMDGPSGKNYLSVHGMLPSNPCELILGLCGGDHRTGARR